MHYIRFLKTPRIGLEHGALLLKAVFTVTTDLGETFYPHSIDISFNLYDGLDFADGDPNGEFYFHDKVKWQAGSRSQSLTINLSDEEYDDWPARLHVYTSDDAKTVGFLPPIVDIWSGALRPKGPQMNSGHRVERRFSTLNRRSISLLEDAGDSIARHLWDGSQVLAQHIVDVVLLQAQATFPLLTDILLFATFDERKTTVLELGCGCGTVGLSLAHAVPNSDVLLTDLPEVEELVRENISRSVCARNSTISFLPLDWEVPLPKPLMSRKNDLIIVSECTYNVDTFRPLVDTLVVLVERSPRAVIVVSTKTRHTSEVEVFDLMKSAGLVEVGSLRVALPGIPGDGYADWATDVGLHVFRGQKFGGSWKDLQ